MMTENERRHPERQRRICYRGEGSRKLVTRGIDSSLCVTVPFPVFPTQHDGERKASSKENAKDLYLW